MLIWLNESNVSNLLISTKFEAQHATWIKMSVSCINLKENLCSICPKKLPKEKIAMNIKHTQMTILSWYTKPNHQFSDKAGHKL